MPATVLIVDDIATNRIVLKVQLSAACYRVVQAGSGAEGAALALREQPDLIICPLDLPDMTGPELVSRIRQDRATADIPVIALSAGRNPERRWEALAAGVDDVLSKPISQPILLARMRNLLRRSRIDAEIAQRAEFQSSVEIGEPGLHEQAATFEPPKRIALVADSIADALRWRNDLAPLLRADELTPMALKDAMRALSEQGRPDAVVVALGDQTSDAGLALLADLRAQAATRRCGTIAITDADSPDLAVEALDRGVGDVLKDGFEPRELALRLRRVIGRKRRADQLRNVMDDGLRAAVLDPLTGLHNRRFAMPRLNQIVRSAHDEGRDFAVLVIDIDHFKTVNDRFGHATGDRVLIKVAQALKQNLRKADLVARIGGEEFLVVLPNADQRGAMARADALCRAVAGLHVTDPAGGAAIRVTASVGVALGSDELRNPGTATAPSEMAQAVLNKADRALYAAKSQGRNKVTLSARRPAA